MNVLQFITPTGIYGAEMWILALAKNLDPQQVNCRLAVTFESEEQNLEVSHRFRSLGLESDHIPMKGRFDPRVIIGLSRLIKEQQIDIIHTHGYKSDILGLLAAKITGIKSVSTPHGFENVDDFKLRTFIRLGCLSFKYFDRVAPLSEDLQADVQRFKVKNEHIRLIGNGVDLTEVESEKAQETASLYANLHEKKIGYIGQMIDRKNVGDLLDTFDLLYKTHKNIRLILIGDGVNRPELEKKARALPSSSHIEFLGFRDDRLQIVKELDLFCMTSSLEGIPRAMMEAMAMGIPVAAYNIPGVDKLILHEHTGMMADFGDVDTLKACWERLLFEGKFSTQIALNGRKHVLEHFSAKRMAEEYTELYRGMLDDSCD